MAHLLIVTAQSIGKTASDIKSVRKLAEGGFNRIFEITMIDESQAIARLPYPSTSPKKLAVASEVATMQLVRANGVPAPQIYSYSTDASNAVGAEYIIMEKMRGRSLGEVWFTLSEANRIKVISEVVAMEAKLFSIELPAYGSIFHATDIPPGSLGVPIPSVCCEAKLQIGPDTSLKHWFEGRSTIDNMREGHAGISHQNLLCLD